jgi:phospholipid/cholesterol/gamma-HCH transport system ATP-binding protein
MIKIKNLQKSFGPKVVLSGIDLELKMGKTTCIIGKSGCGKSVLLKHMVGLLTPDSGIVEIDGSDVSHLKYDELFELRRKIGFVFQGGALFDSYTVYENVIVSLYEHGEKNEQVLVNEAMRVLSAVGLLPDLSEKGTENFEKEWQIIKNKKPADLSGGMRKRVAVARALVGSPEYIFYDEPTTGLDPVTSEQIDDMIYELAQKMNVTSIVITHDMFSVFRIADEVAMLDKGKVLFEGSAEELKATNDPIVKEFISRFMIS